MVKNSNEIPYDKSDPDTIKSMFSKVAKSYDFGNSLLSMQLHRLWNKELVNAVQSCNPGHLLDLCCGTGAISLAYLKNEEQFREATLIDFCPEMLIQARLSAEKMQLARHQLHYECADAQAIPLHDAAVDCVTIAYGIRNVKDTEKCLKETYRVLRFGGMIGILELTQPSNALLKACHRFYLSKVLPVVGKLFLAESQAYSYLGSSIQQFIAPEKLKELMASVGYRDIVIKRLFGGTATLLTGKK